MPARKTAAHALAQAMLCGGITKTGLITRGAAVLGKRPAWLPRMAERIVGHFGEGSRPRQFRLESFILSDAGFLRAWERPTFAVRTTQPLPPKMCPAEGPPRTWNVPALCTPGEFAQWLNLRPNELAWFADWRGLEAKVAPGPLRHYLYRWQPKRDGSARLVESPKQRLKAIQRHLLREILDRIPPHEAAHGFRTGRCVRSFASPHVGRKMVLRLDLKDFFPRISRAWVVAIFLTAGYPETTAQLLAGLCTNGTPGAVLKTYPVAQTAAAAWQMRKVYESSHLPQGAPTSPALANLAAYRLDCRLTGLAQAAGACYTRYADDLVFSGEQNFARGVERFYIAVCAIALEEGFEVNPRKTRLMPRSVSQRVAGTVLNQHLNVPRSEYDQLKAIIHNCAKHGPASQNRSGVADFRAHLAGRIAWIETINPTRGLKLRQEFRRIEWDSPPGLISDH